MVLINKLGSKYLEDVGNKNVCEDGLILEFVEDQTEKNMFGSCKTRWQCIKIYKRIN